MSSALRKLHTHQKISLAMIILVLVSMPVALFMSLNPINFTESSAGKGGLLATPPYYLDPQSGSNYDFDVTSDVDTYVNPGPGLAYLANTEFRIENKGVNDIRVLRGFLQEDPGTVGDAEVPFSKEGNVFISSRVLLHSNNCIDLYSTDSQEPEDYLSTFCYRVTNTQSGGNVLLYSPNATMSLSATQVSSGVIVYQSLTPAFDKFEINLPPDYSGLPLRKPRVNYFAYDSDLVSGGVFENVRFVIDVSTGGLNNQQVGSLCSDTPQKYLYNYADNNPFRSDASGTPMSKFNFCSFEYLSENSLPNGFLGLGMAGDALLPVQIQVTGLKRARVGESYNQSIKGIDNDFNGNGELSMSITNLPPGMNQGDCSIKHSNNGAMVVECSVQGKPKTEGEQMVDIRIDDSYQGSFTAIRLPLVVSPGSRR